MHMEEYHSAQKMMIAGSREISYEGIRYAQRVVQRCIEENMWVQVGDNLQGIDAAVRAECYRAKYERLTVYKPHNRPVRVAQFEIPRMFNAGKGYRGRDEKMCEFSDFGMFIWNGESPGTKHGYDFMCSLNKSCWLWQDGKIIAQYIPY